MATINLTGLAGGTNMTEHSGSQKVNQSSGSHKKSELLGQLSPSMYPYGSSLQKLDESSNQVSISSSQNNNCSMQQHLQQHHFAS